MDSMRLFCMFISSTRGGYHLPGDDVVEEHVPQGPEGLLPVRVVYPDQVSLHLPVTVRAFVWMPGEFELRSQTNHPPQKVYICIMHIISCTYNMHEYVRESNFKDNMSTNMCTNVTLKTHSSTKRKFISKEK